MSRSQSFLFQIYTVKRGSKLEWGLVVFQVHHSSTT